MFGFMKNRYSFPFSFFKLKFFKFGLWVQHRLYYL